MKTRKFTEQKFVNILNTGIYDALRFGGGGGHFYKKLDVLDIAVNTEYRNY